MKDTGIIRFDWIDEQMPKDEYSEDERKTMCYAVFMYRNGDGEEPIFDDRSLRTCWRNIKKEIDANVKKYEETTEKNRANGAKGGRPKNPQKPSETQNNRSVFEETHKNPAKPNETLYDNEYDNDNDNENDIKEKEIPNGISKKKNQKHKHGKFKNVLLTDDQYVQLQEKFPLDYDERIEELSFGIEQYGYKYKNHLLAIIQWAKNGRGKNKAKGRDDPKYKPGDYSLDAWQRKQAEHPEDDDIYEVF